MATKIQELETNIAGMKRKTTNYDNKDTHTSNQMDLLKVKIKTIENELKKFKDDNNFPSTVDHGNTFYSTVINQAEKINNLSDPKSQPRTRATKMSKTK